MLHAALLTGLIAQDSFEEPPELWPEVPSGMEPGFPSGFVALFVLVLVVAIGTAIYKVWWTGELARRRGHDPSEARMVSFLTGDLGTAAEYIRPATTSGQHERATTQPEAAGRSVEARLSELAGLVERGLVTPEEAAERRAEILDEL